METSCPAAGGHRPPGNSAGHEAGIESYMGEGGKGYACLLLTVLMEAISSMSNRGQARAQLHCPVNLPFHDLTST